jgi:hypothetical protein
LAASGASAALDRGPGVGVATGVAAERTAAPPPSWNGSAIVRLPPRHFRELPAPVVRVLERLGCTVPRTYLGKAFRNVIHGQFGKRGQRDWAVLCSRHGSSSILVFWRGLPTGWSELAPREDSIYLQVVDVVNGQNIVGYSRGISAAGRRQILDERAFAEQGVASGAARGPVTPYPPVIDHQGIDDAFLGKASEIYYRYRRKWWVLEGAD